MTKYIIEYVSGTKGDLLCRFLNNQKLYVDGNNKTIPADIGCINWLKLLNPYHLTEERMREVLDKNPFTYLPSHPLWKDWSPLLELYDYEIIKLRFDQRHYRTIYLESRIKNNIRAQDAAHLMNQLFWSGASWDSFITSDIEKELSPVELLWTDRVKVYELFLNMTNNRTFIEYNDLFIEFRSDIFEGYDLDEWKQFVFSSWCEASPELFKEGYRDFSLPIPELNPETVFKKYSNIVEKYTLDKLYEEHYEK